MMLGFVTDLCCRERFQVSGFCTKFKHKVIGGSSLKIVKRGLQCLSLLQVDPM